jgi:multiple antibiotic resistance protein
MNEYFTAWLLFFTSFITLMNPLGVMPVFLTMTGGIDQKQRRNTAVKASVTAFFTLIAFAFGGEMLFAFFGISVAGLKVVGGVLFFIIGYDMLNARVSRTKISKEEAKVYVNDISITPLGIPMIAGPGSITNAIILMDQSEGFATRSILISAIFAVCLVTMVILISGSRILRFLGETGNKVMMKLMGLIVMVIAVEFFFTGIKYYVKLIVESI